MAATSATAAEGVTAKVASTPLAFFGGETRLDPSCYTLFRLDGHGFSRFVKRAGMTKPFDAAFTAAMQRTGEALLEAHHFELAFVGSDEITLVWMPLSPAAVEAEHELPFRGRILKLTSLLAGLASVVFLTAVVEEGNAQATALLPHFDCRVFQLDTADQVLAALRERQTFTVKNARMMFAQSFCSHKSLQGVASEAAVAKVAVEHGVHFDEAVPVANRMGGFLHRVPTPMSTVLPTGKTIDFVRRVPTWVTSSGDAAFLASVQRAA